MKNNKTSGMSAWKLALIITGSIVAAAAVIFAVVTVIKKMKAKKAIEGCDCDCCDEDWEFDDDLLGDLRFDDECEGECECESCDCGCEGDCDVSAAVDEAIEAIEKMSDDEE